jgi:hydroxymethylglutaryl-CoA reductase (NADPH)
MAGIISSTLLPRSWSSKEPSQRTPPGPVGRNVGNFFVGLSKRACLHPIYTIVSVAILASTTYLGLLENSLFDRRISANNAVGRIDLNNILTGSKKLYSGPDTQWKWSTDETRNFGDTEDVSTPITLQSALHESRY